MVEQRQAQAGADGPGPAAPVRELARSGTTPGQDARPGGCWDTGRPEPRRCWRWRGAAWLRRRGCRAVAGRPRTAGPAPGQGKVGAPVVVALVLLPRLCPGPLMRNLPIRQLVAQCPGRSPSSSAIWLMLAAACASSGGGCARDWPGRRAAAPGPAGPPCRPGRAPPGCACALPARRCPRAPAGSGAGRCAVRNSCAPRRWPASAGPGPAARPGGRRRRRRPRWAAHAAPQVQFPGCVEAGLI